MPENEISRLSRLTAIITLLQSKKLITASFISKKFSISVRTVYRDIRSLEEAGVPIRTEEGKGYSLIEEYALPPVMFSEDEASALITADQFVSKNKDASFVKNYSDALIKIKALLKHAAKDKAEFLSQRIVFRQNATRQITSNYLSSLQLAITNYRLIKMWYHSENSDKPVERTIEPFGLYSTNENWILVAYCQLRKENRAFRLDRIRELKLLDMTFKPHNFTLQDYFDECRAKFFGNP
jgi:predicted DNA-binding transcriptional regulator YafY